MDITKRKCQETNQPLLTAKSVTKVRALQLFQVPGSTNTQMVDNTASESTSNTNKSEASNKCEESPLIVSIGNTYTKMVDNTSTEWVTVLAPTEEMKAKGRKHRSIKITPTDLFKIGQMPDVHILSSRDKFCRRKHTKIFQ